MDRLASLKAAQEVAGISNRELARRSGLDVPHIGRIMTKKLVATDATLDRISIAIFGTVTFPAQAQLPSGEVFSVDITAPVELVRRALEGNENDQGADGG